MTSDRELAQARRYLLGDTSDEESSAIEREYLRDAAAVERIAAAEDALIEDFLDDRLSPAERASFEQGYLASPAHRARVATVRRLRRPAAVRAAAAPSWWPLAAAAVLVLAVAATYVFARRSAPHPSAAVAANPERPTASPPPPRVVSLSISPVAVRSAGETRSVSIPSGTDAVVFDLESELPGVPLTDARAIVRTVTGTAIWSGPATVGGVVPAGVLARVDVPAARLRPDDYVIALLGKDATGAEREVARYFLRVLP